MNPVALVGQALGRAIIGHTLRGYLRGNERISYELNPVFALKTELANNALIMFDTKTRRAVARALNEAMRNAYSATIRDVLAQSGIKKRSALTGREGKSGRIRWYRAHEKYLKAALFVGLKSEPGLTLVRTGAVTGTPGAATIAKANRRKRTQGKHAQKMAARAVSAGTFPNLMTTSGKPYSKLFWAQMPSGHTGVFARRTRKRLEIDEPYLAIGDMARRIGDSHMFRQMRITFPRSLIRNLGI